MSIQPAPRRGKSAPIDSPCLDQALALLGRGFWPVLIYPPGYKRPRLKELTKGKEPVGMEWGLARKTETELRNLIEWARGKGFTPHGCGICLGPDRAPGGGWLIDLEGDGPRAEESLLRFLGGEPVATYGWKATRGSHALFTADGERLLELLAAAGAEEGKGHEAGKFTLHDFPDLEFRIGRYAPDGKTSLQFQSVAPPTPGTDGKPRRWNMVDTVAELPEAAYAALEAAAEAVAEASAERLAIREADQEEEPHILPLAGDGKPLTMRAPVKTRPDAETRAVAYIGKADPAISGQGGHKTAIRVACEGFR
jgi:hypothetical protein